MANLRTLGVIATMALGAAGFVACSGGKKAEEKPVTNPTVKQDSVPQKKENIEVMPPLTMVEGGDTLVFNSKADSTDYQKYNRIAFDNFSRISRNDKEKMDSLLNATKQEADSISNAEHKEWHPKYDAIQEKYNNDLEKLEQQYKDGKITFEKLEAEKKSLETKKDNEESKLFSKYQKGDYAQNAYYGLYNLEQRRHEQVDSEAYAQYQKDRDEMRKKYCKEVRPYASKTSTSKPDYVVKGMTIDGVKVKWKSPKDSVAVSNYINEKVDREEKANGKIWEQQAKLEGQIAEIEYKQEQLEYEANVLYKQGKTQAAINKEQQMAKLGEKIDKLYEQISSLDEKCQYEDVSIDTINKHSVQKFDKNYKKMTFNF